MTDAFKNLLKFLIPQVPLLAVLYAYWPTINQNPVGAFILAILYEVLALFLAFGKKVWAELEPEAVQATADWIKNTFLNLVSGFRRRYNRQVNYSHRFFNTSGLRTKAGKTLEVEQVFVELRMAHSDLQKARLNPVAVKELSGNQSIWTFIKQLEQQTPNPADQIKRYGKNRRYESISFRHSGPLAAHPKP